MVLSSVAVLAVYLCFHFGKLSWWADMAREDAFLTLISPKLAAGAIRALRVVVVLSYDAHRAVALFQDVGVLSFWAMVARCCCCALLKSTQLARNATIRRLPARWMILTNRTTNTKAGVGLACNTAPETSSTIDAHVATSPRKR